MTVAAQPVSTTEAASSDRLTHLQALRGFAASLVVVAHTIDALIKHHAIEKSPNVMLDYFGYFGVCTFFVISGFIIYRSSYNAYGHIAPVSVFLRKRLIRIFPIYLIATLVFILLSPKRATFGFADIASSIALIPHYDPAEGNMHPLLGQGWTLQYEILFYVLFTLCLLFRRAVGLTLIFVLIFSLVGLGTLYMPLGDLSEPTSLLAYWSRPIIILFPAGIALGMIERSYGLSIAVRWPLVLVAAIFGAFIAAGPLFDLNSDDASMLRFATWIPCLLCVVVCVFTKGTGGRFEYVIQKFGDASYSTYLFHLFIVSALVRTSLINGNTVVFVVLAVVLANLLGLGVFVWIERPILRQLRIRLLPRRAPAPIFHIGEANAASASNARAS